MEIWVVWEPFEEEDSILPHFATTNLQVARDYARRSNHELGIPFPNERIQVARVSLLGDEEAQAMAAGSGYRVLLSFEGEIVALHPMKISNTMCDDLDNSSYPRMLCNAETRLIPAIEFCVPALDPDTATSLAGQSLARIRANESQLAWLEATLMGIESWRDEGCPFGDYHEYLMADESEH